MKNITIYKVETDGGMGLNRRIIGCSMNENLAEYIAQGRGSYGTDGWICKEEYTIYETKEEFDNSER